MVKKIDMVVSRPYTETEGAKLGFDLAQKIGIECEQMLVVEATVVPDDMPATIVTCDDSLVTGLYIGSDLAGLRDDLVDAQADLLIQCDVLKHEVNAIDGIFEVECSFT